MAMTSRRRFLPVAALASIALAGALGARAADRVVQMQVPPPLSKDMDAMPKIADPADDAERAINAALARLDAANLREIRAGCDEEAGVFVPMQGPGFLSFVVSHTTMGCGRTQNDLSTYVYDLRTGAPADWTKLLPPGLTGKVTDEGDRAASLASKALFADYLALYRNDPDNAGADPSCLQEVVDAGAAAPPAMEVWLDADKDGLGLNLDLLDPACAAPEVMPTTALLAAGADPGLVAAIDAAHRAHAYGRTFWQ
jgi:hypothetical protein